MITQFKKDLEKSIIDQLVFKTDLSRTQAELVDIDFSFNNKRMLEYLTERSAALKSAKFDKATEIELAMTKYKDENYEKIVTPNKAFCIFKYHKAFLKIIENSKRFSYRGQKL